MSDNKLRDAQNEYRRLSIFDDIFQNLCRIQDQPILLDPITRTPQTDYHLPLSRQELIELRQMLEKELFGKVL
jgi:hypothetical protein